MEGPALEVLSMITIWVKERAGLSDILPHAVGEMARRARGGVLVRSISYTDAPGNLQVSPIGPPAAPGAPRPPADASGGQEKGPLSLHTQWIQAQGRKRIVSYPLIFHV